VVFSTLVDFVEFLESSNGLLTQILYEFLGWFEVYDHSFGYGYDFPCFGMADFFGRSLLFGEGAEAAKVESFICFKAFGYVGKDEFYNLDRLYLGKKEFLSNGKG